MQVSAHKLPLRKRDGTLHAYAYVDGVDKWACEFRWSLLNDRYVVRMPRKHENLPRRLLYLHREIMGLKSFDGLEVDHIDRNPLNCRRTNMRVVTHAEQMQNLSSHASSSSEFRGVSWERKRNKWLAQGVLGRRRINLGVYESEEEAAKVAQAFRFKHMTHAVD